MAPERTLRRQTLVPASVGAVWNAWTTADGLTSFLAPHANLRLCNGGPYEMLFDLAAPVGSQGTEGMRVLCYLPEELLAFEWNAPPHLSDVRRERTWVVVQLAAQSPAATSVTLTHLGWGAGDAWDAAYAYFERAWSLVLARLVYRFMVAPIDWALPYTPD
ncbi:MAG: SRPBCC family protein [Anaerolineae bacterium]